MQQDPSGSSLFSSSLNVKEDTKQGSKSLNLTLSHCVKQTVIGIHNLYQEEWANVSVYDAGTKVEDRF